MPLASIGVEEVDGGSFGMIRRVLTGVGVNIFDKFVVAGTQLAIVSVLATRWGLHLYGFWVLLSTVPSFLAMGDFGFATAAGTKMTMANARGERDKVIFIFHSAWRAILLSSILMIVVAVVATELMPGTVFGGESDITVGAARLTLLLLSLYGIAVIQGSIFFAAFRAARLFAIGAFWNALTILVESSALLIAVVAGARPDMSAAVLLGGRITCLVGQNILLRRLVPWLPIGVRRGSWAETHALLAPAGAVMLLPAAQAIALQGTAVALGAATGAALVPIFTAARTLSRIGLQMCWLLNTALMPEFSAAAAKSDQRGMNMMICVTLAASAVLIIPYALGFGLFGQATILLWTHGVIHSPGLMIWVMALGILFGGFWYPLSNLILALNRHAGYTIWYVALAAVDMPIAFVLARAMGPIGAGIALTMLDAAMFLVIVLQTHRLLAPWREIGASISEMAAWFSHFRRRSPGAKT